MKKLYSCNLQGSAKFNEDRVGHYQNVAWVIDGATPLFSNHYISEENDVVWMVKRINENLPQFISNELSLEDILAQTIQQVNDAALAINPHLNEINNYELPTFTIAMVRFVHGKLEYFVLGDSGILIESNERPIYITDRCLDIFGNKIEEEINKSEMKVNKLQEIRKYLNKENGYWIGSLDGKGIPHGLTGELKVNKNTRVLCFTDGYSRLFELYKKMDIERFQFDVHVIKNSISLIRKIEVEDSDCSAYERSKKSDDLSVMLVENRYI